MLIEKRPENVRGVGYDRKDIGSLDEIVVCIDLHRPLPELSDECFLRTALDGTRSRPANRLYSIVRRRPQANQTTGRDHTGAAEAAGAVDDDPLPLLEALADGAHPGGETLHIFRRLPLLQRNPDGIHTVGVHPPKETIEPQKSDFAPG